MKIFFIEFQLLAFLTAVEPFFKQCFRWSQSALAGGVATDGANKEKVVPGCLLTRNLIIYQLYPYQKSVHYISPVLKIIEKLFLNPIYYFEIHV